jgi:hypothetical protein
MVDSAKRKSLLSNLTPKETVNDILLVLAARG